MIPFLVIIGVVSALGAIGKAAKVRSMQMVDSSTIDFLGDNHKSHKPSTSLAPWQGRPPIITLRNPDTIPGVWPGLGSGGSSGGGGGSSSGGSSSSGASAGISSPAGNGASGNGGLSGNRLNLL